MKTNWNAKLKKLLEEEKSTNNPKTALTKTDEKLNLGLSSVSVSSESGNISEKTDFSTENEICPDLVSSVFVSSDYMDSPENYNDLFKLKNEKLCSILDDFKSNGIDFVVCSDDFQIVGKTHELNTSDRQFLKINQESVLCTLQLSLLTKHWFSHSPELFEAFVFEVYERESILTETDKTTFENYVEAFFQTSKVWYSRLWNKCFEK